MFNYLPDEIFHDFFKKKTQNIWVVEIRVFEKRRSTDFVAQKCLKCPIGDLAIEATA